MSDSKPTSSQTINPTDGEAAEDTAKPTTSSEEISIQPPLITNTPPRCEMCDAPVPDEAARKAHMAETKHCICWKCDAYVPPGGLYGHWSDVHYDLEWKDHAVAWTDNVNVNSAMPWVREAREKAARGTEDEVLSRRKI
jgi:hypothetical protein